MKYEYNLPIKQERTAIAGKKEQPFKRSPPPLPQTELISASSGLPLCCVFISTTAIYLFACACPSDV